MKFYLKLLNFLQRGFYTWEEDVSYAGSEISSYINKPKEIEILGKTEIIKDKNYIRDMERLFRILSDDKNTWSQNVL